MTQKIKMILNKDWKFYSGITFVIISFFLPLFGFIVIPMNIKPSIAIPLIAFLTIGGPEITMIIGVSLLGKNVYYYYKNKILNILKIKSKKDEISKTRHCLGISIMILTIVPFYLNTYLPCIFPENIYLKNAILFSADLLFVISFFILGGNFWGKFKKLFSYDEKVL